MQLTFDVGSNCNTYTILVKHRSQGADITWFSFSWKIYIPLRESYNRKWREPFIPVIVYHPKSLCSVLPRSYKKSQMNQICCTHKIVHLFEGLFLKCNQVSTHEAKMVYGIKTPQSPTAWKPLKSMTCMK